jgi:hypothetical protein
LAVLVLSFVLPAVGVPSSADAQVNADIQPENLSIGLPKPVPRPGNPGPNNSLSVVVKLVVKSSRPAASSKAVYKTCNVKLVSRTGNPGPK